MTVKLSSLRVTAEMNVDQYVRAASQKVAADGSMVQSAKDVGQALAATDAAAAKAVPGVASLSRTWITGYGDAAKFETAVRSVGKAMDRGMDAGRASMILESIYKKFGQTADAAALARQGFVQLAPVIDTVNARYDAMTAAAQKAAAAQRFVNAGKSFVAQYEAEAQAQRKLVAEINPLAEAIRVRTERQEVLNAALASGRINEDQFRMGMTRANKVFDDTKRAIDSTNVAMGKYASGAGFARHELVNLSRQAQDVFVSLASGQSPMTVLIQQGTQIADVFAASKGSVGGFFAQLPGMMRAALGPMAAVSAGLAAIAAAYAAVSRAEQRSELSKSLLGAGRGVGLTGDQYNQQAVISAETAQISVTSARQIAAEYAKLGQIAGSALPRLTQLTKDYAIVTGQDMKQSAQEMARALADPERGAQMLADKLGSLDSTTLRAIRTALSFNDTLRAQKLLMEAVAQATDGAANAQSKWERVKAAVGRGVDATLEGAANLVLPKDAEERLASLETRAKVLRESLANAVSTATPMSRGAQNELSRIQQQIDALRLQRDNLQAVAKAKADNIEANKRVNAAEAAGLSGMLKTQMAMQMAERNVNVYTQSLEELEKKRRAAVSASPDGGLSKEVIDLTLQIEQQKKGLEAAKKQAEDYRNVTAGLTVEEERARRVQEARAKGLNDVTLEQRQATAARVAEAESYGEALSATQALERAERARKEVTIDARRQAAESARASNDNVTALNAERQAIQQNGVVAAQVARIRADANREAAATGENPQLVFQRKLNEAIAETQKQQATLLSQSRESSRIAAGANGAAAAGGLSPQRRQQAEELRRIEGEIAQLRAAGLISDKEAVALSQQRVAAARQEQSARNEGAAQDYLYQQEQTLETQRKQLEMIYKSHDARYEELEVLKARQFLEENGISAESDRGRKILENAALIGRQNREYETQLKLQNQIRQAQEFAADSLKSFLDELLTGTEGINGALKSLGKGFLSASLDALISGKGPLAGITGLASSTKDGQGGILGLLTTGIQGLGKQVEKGAEKGTATGAAVGISTVASNDNIAWLGGISGKDLAGGLTAIAGLAGAYGSGMAAGSYAQAVGGGALSGGMGGLALAGTSIGASLGGAAVLGPIGVIAGAALGYFGQQQARKQAREQREREAQENYKNAQPAIATMRSQLRGDPQNTLKIQIAEAEAATRKLTDVMFFAKKYDEERETYLDFKKYEARLLSEYRDGFIGMIQSMEAGLGPNSPFAQAKSAVADFGKELQGFIENAETAFGQGTPQVDQARQASIAYAVSVLDGAKSLTLVQQRMQEIQGTGAGLVKVLVDLGVASEQAGEAVTAGVAMAVQRLRDTFETDLQAKTNEALDKGYLNDARSLLLEIQQLATDSRTLGTDPGNITRYFQAAAQNLVNEANLTGDAFTEFLALFPEFTGNVVAAGQALEDASRRLGYLDRLFAATNDTSTLAGQLAAYDRQAMREREEEIKLGGQYILELEAAQQAERYNIIRDFNKAANDNYRQSLQQAQDYVARFTRSIQEYLDGLRAGSDSPLSPQARLAAAQSQYNAQLVLAQGGDRNALDGITSYASDLIDAAKGFFASSTGFQDIFAQIQSQLGALPSQISAEQFIVNAIEAGADQTVAAVDAMKVTLQSAVSSGSASEIAAALSTYFNRIDSNTSASIDFNEMRSALGGMASDSQLRDMFTRIDTDNSGSISRLEAINTATGQVRASNLNQESSLATANQIAQSVASLNNSINQNIATGNGILYEVRNATNAVNQSSLASSTYSDLIVRNLRSQAQNWGAQNVHGYAIPFFRDGGLIGGRGTGTSDSNLIRASRGEFMMSERATNFFGPGMLSQMNDNLAMPAMPVPVMGGGGDMRAVVVGLEKVTAAVQKMEASNVRATVAAAEHVGDEVKIASSKQEDAARRSRLMAA